ncbi:hypothetical protein BY458DRAFT_509794, partial [Sporodiniella umbellata]
MSIAHVFDYEISPFTTIVFYTAINSLKVLKFSWSESKICFLQVISSLKVFVPIFVALCRLL